MVFLERLHNFVYLLSVFLYHLLVDILTVLVVEAKGVLLAVETMDLVAIS